MIFLSFYRTPMRHSIPQPAFVSGKSLKTNLTMTQTATTRQAMELPTVVVLGKGVLRGSLEDKQTLRPQPPPVSFSVAKLYLRTKPGGAQRASFINYAKLICLYASQLRTCQLLQGLTDVIFDELKLQFRKRSGLAWVLSL